VVFGLLVGGVVCQWYKKLTKRSRYFAKPVNIITQGMRDYRRQKPRLGNSRLDSRIGGRNEGKTELSSNKKGKGKCNLSLGNYFSSSKRKTKRATGGQWGGGFSLAVSNDPRGQNDQSHGSGRTVHEANTVG